MRRLWVVLPVSVALSVTGLMALQDEREVTLRFQFQPRQVFTYEQSAKGEMVMTTQAAGQDLGFTTTFSGTMTQTQQVESVDKEGVATLLLTMRGKMQMEATGLPAGANVPPEQEIPPTRMRMKVNPLGKVSQIQMLPAEGEQKQPSPQIPFGMGRFSFQSPQEAGWHGLLFPEKPVRKGDSWDISQSLEMTVEERTVKMDIKGQARLVDFEKLGERECAVLETTIEMPNLGDLFSQMAPAGLAQGDFQADGEVRATGKHWFDFTTGQLLRSDGEAEMTMNLSFSLPTGQTFNMSMRGNFRTEQRLTKVGRAKPEEK